MAMWAALFFGDCISCCMLLMRADVVHFSVTTVSATTGLVKPVWKGFSKG